MPFGGLGSYPDEKAKEDISNRVKIIDHTYVSDELNGQGVEKLLLNKPLNV